MSPDPAINYRRLTIAERLQLVEDIWDSIAADADADSLPVSDDEKAMLDDGEPTVVNCGVRGHAL